MGLSPSPTVTNTLITLLLLLHSTSHTRKFTVRLPVCSVYFAFPASLTVSSVCGGSTLSTIQQKQAPGTHKHCTATPVGNHCHLQLFQHSTSTPHPPPIPHLSRLDLSSRAGHYFTLHIPISISISKINTRPTSSNNRTTNCQIANIQSVRPPRANATLPDAVLNALDLALRYRVPNSPPSLEKHIQTSHSTVCLRVYTYSTSLQFCCRVFNVSC